MTTDAISDYMTWWRNKRESAQADFESRGLRATQEYIARERAHPVRLLFGICLSTPSTAVYRGAQDALESLIAGERTAVVR